MGLRGGKLWTSLLNDPFTNIVYYQIFSENLVVSRLNDLFHEYSFNMPKLNRTFHLKIRKIILY